MGTDEWVLVNGWRYTGLVGFREINPRTFKFVKEKSFQGISTYSLSPGLFVLNYLVKLKARMALRFFRLKKFLTGRKNNHGKSPVGF